MKKKFSWLYTLLMIDELVHAQLKEMINFTMIEVPPAYNTLRPIEKNTRVSVTTRAGTKLFRFLR